MRVLSIAISITLMSCQPRTAIQDDSGPPTSEQIQLSHGYALLYELTNKQSDLDKALFLGGGMSDAAKQLIRDIDAASERAAEQIRQFADVEPWMELSDLGLPEAEIGSRRAIEKLTTRRLLFSGGAFEFRLLLSQADATQYGVSLAESLREMDNHAGRRAWLEEFSSEYKSLFEKVEAQLSARKGNKS